VTIVKREVKKFTYKSSTTLPLPMSICAFVPKKDSHNIEGSTYRATYGTGSIKMRVSAQAAIQTEAIGASDELLLVFHHIGLNINMFILSVGVSKAFY
jgi:hypothetical protein